MGNVKVADDYKDRLFRMIFNDKEKLLELYNAMNGSDYKDASELQAAYSARTAHPFQRNGALFRFKLSKAQQVY